MTGLSGSIDPEVVQAERATRSASAVKPGQWGYGINVYGKRRRYQAKPSEKSTLNAAMYGFWSDEYNRVQAYLRTHGKLPVGSSKSLFCFSSKVIILWGWSPP